MFCLASSRSWRSKKYPIIFAACLFSFVGAAHPSSGTYKGTNSSETLNRLRQRAEAGDKKAQLDLGVKYKMGSEVPRDYAQALKWFHKAADQGYERAYYNLGVMYLQGDGVPINKKTAFDWFLKSAQAGLNKGQFMMGQYYENGIVVHRDHRKAREWYKKAAANGSVEAQQTLKGLTRRYSNTPQRHKVCSFPYMYRELPIPSAMLEPTYCGSIRQSRVESSSYWLPVATLIGTVNMDKAEKLAGFPLYFPAELPYFDFDSFFAAIEKPGSSNAGRGFSIHRKFINGYFNYVFQTYPRGTLDFFLLSAADAVDLGNDGVFHCLGSLQTITHPRRIDVCTENFLSMARWWSPDNKVYIAMRQNQPILDLEDFTMIAGSMTPLKDVAF